MRRRIGRIDIDRERAYWNVNFKSFAIEKRRKFTSSGIERTYTIWRFARWSYSFTTWRAG